MNANAIDRRALEGSCGRALAELARLRSADLPAQLAEGLGRVQDELLTILQPPRRDDLQALRTLVQKWSF